jgi:hypothetical protein
MITKTDSHGEQWAVCPNGRYIHCVGYLGETRSAYMFRSEFEHHCGTAPQTGPLFATPEHLRAAKACAAECGWVRVLLVAVDHGGYKE